MAQSQRLSGTVSHYSKVKGYGFIEPSQKGVIPGDSVFVHWKAIQTKDRFPYLDKDMTVEFTAIDSQKQGEKWNAANVTLPGGDMLNLQKEADAKHKTFLGGQDKRYSGKLKFYDARRGFGYVLIEPAAGTVDEVEVPAEVRVDRMEINAAGELPVSMQDLAVEFGLWVTARGNVQAYNLTLPEGVPVVQSVLENRQLVADAVFTGEVTSWAWQRSWGFIKADADKPLPPHVQAKLTQQTEEAKKRAAAANRSCTSEELLYFRRPDVKRAAGLRQGMKVRFKLYVDDKGAGAYEVEMCDTPPAAA
eukprot:TRINITY_DN21270_c0_g1_i1.p1 TRINITY_DN21270_c0_g1~~TRINITY_DN21270_c0_g1_i1.p1  ORF type:complete len:305 (+),score=111.55 TRINITY_DN21270_c0_g1_i1:119-1033(+)